MTFDNPAFGRKNYEEYLRDARETLLVKYLSDDDRRIIERGIYYLIRGDDLLKREDPESLREAAWLLMIGGYYLGARCAVSDSESEYWRRIRCGKGGRGGKEKEKGKNKREAREAWQLYAKELEGANTETTITALAGSLLIDMKRPAATPSNLRTLEKFLGKARRERLAAGKAPPIRLIHSA